MELNSLLRASIMDELLKRPHAPWNVGPEADLVRKQIKQVEEHWEHLPACDTLLRIADSINHVR